MSTNTFQHILIGLDLTPTDDFILSFLGQNSSVLSADKLFFIHVNNSETSSRDEIRQKVSDKIANSGAMKNLDYDIHISSGDPEKEIKHWSQKQKIDLLVMGHKPTDEHEVEAKKLVQKPASSLLLIPHNEDYTIKTICVAIDFSDLSAAALKAAQNIARKTNAKVIGFHTYKVPSGYHKSGMEHDEFAEVMEKNAREEADSFLEKDGVSGTEMKYAYNEKDEPSDYIAACARNINANLLVIGSKGRTGPASLLLGSVSKKLVQLVHDIPIMIIKDKNERMDIVDALKKV